MNEQHEYRNNVMHEYHRSQMQDRLDGVEVPFEGGSVTVPRGVVEYIRSICPTQEAATLRRWLTECARLSGVAVD
jgi:hypothetical protein